MHGCLTQMPLYGYQSGARPVVPVLSKSKTIEAIVLSTAHRLACRVQRDRRGALVALSCSDGETAAESARYALSHPTQRTRLNAAMQQTEALHAHSTRAERAGEKQAARVHLAHSTGEAS